MTVAIALLRKQIIQHIPEANDPMIDRVFIETCRDFCEFTRAWRVTQALTITADTLNVVVTPPTGGELVDVVDCETEDGKDITKATQTQIKQKVSKWRTAAGAPDFVTLGDALNELYFVPTSQTTLTTSVQTRMAFKPILSAVVFDELMISKYIDTLIAGTLARLYIMPKQVWTDGTLASYYTTKYDDERDDAKRKVTAGNMTGVSRKIRYGGL
jgi:hypothetical protein